MGSEQQDREAALRAMLVAQVSGQHERHRASSLTRPGAWQAAVVTAVVLVAVVTLSLGALRLGGQRQSPAVGGSPMATTSDPRSTPTLPAGPVLGRFTSDDGANQEHTIKPDGLALAMAFTCTGRGSYSVSIAHFTEQGGYPKCDGGGSASGNAGVAGTTTVKIRTDTRMRWTLTIVGIPETYVTPRPIPTPTDTTGIAVPYCTADDLTAKFNPRQMPDSVTEAEGGELAFTNRTTHTCALAGYPEVRFLDNGAPLGHHTMNHTDERSSEEHGLKAAIVAPGGSAYSQIDWYLPNYYPANEEGTCVARTVTSVEVDLNYDLAAPSQTGTLTVPIGTTTACLNGQHGALGKYGQISSTVFVDYSLTKH